MPAGGGRVTELVARPLLNLHWPELAGVVQPLAGRVRGPPRAAGAAAVPDRLRRRARAAGRRPAAGRAATRSPRSTCPGARTATRTTAGPDGQRDPAGRVRAAAPGGPAVMAPPATALTQFERSEDGYVLLTLDMARQSGRRCGRSRSTWRATAKPGEGPLHRPRRDDGRAVRQLLRRGRPHPDTGARPGAAGAAPGRRRARAGLRPDPAAAAGGGARSSARTGSWPSSARWSAGTTAGRCGCCRARCRRRTATGRRSR